MNFACMKKTALCSAILLALAGCHGDDDDDDGGGVANPMAVTGTAVKGLVSGATVTALDADGDEVATTTTDELGEFTLNVPDDAPRPIKLQLTGGTDTVTSMDLIGTLETLVFEEGEEIDQTTANLSPMTTLITALAENMAGEEGVDMEDLEMASARVVETLGFNIDEIDPLTASLDAGNILPYLFAQEMMGEMLRRITLDTDDDEDGLTAEDNAEYNGIIDALADLLNDDDEFESVGGLDAGEFEALANLQAALVAAEFFSGTFQISIGGELTDPTNTVMAIFSNLTDFGVENAQAQIDTTFLSADFVNQLTDYVDNAYNFIDYLAQATGADPDEVSQLFSDLLNTVRALNPDQTLGDLGDALEPFAARLAAQRTLTRQIGRNLRDNDVDIVVPGGDALRLGTNTVTINQYDEDGEIDEDMSFTATGMVTDMVFGIDLPEPLDGDNIRAIADDPEAGELPFISVPVVRFPAGDDVPVDLTLRLIRGDDLELEGAGEYEITVTMSATWTSSGEDGEDGEMTLTLPEQAVQVSYRNGAGLNIPAQPVINDVADILRVNSEGPQKPVTLEIKFARVFGNPQVRQVNPGLLDDGDYFFQIGFDPVEGNRGLPLRGANGRDFDTIEGTFSLATSEEEED